MCFVFVKAVSPRSKSGVQRQPKREFYRGRESGPTWTKTGRIERVYEGEALLTEGGKRTDGRSTCREYRSLYLGRDAPEEIES